MKTGSPPETYIRIWQTVRVIPPGRVASYGQIADLAGLPRRARLVGKALREAPQDSGVPWHRVLRADGRIAFPAGSELARRQRDRLQQEDIVVLNGRVNLKHFAWRPDLSDLLMRLQY